MSVQTAMIVLLGTLLVGTALVATDTYAVGGSVAAGGEMIRCDTGGMPRSYPGVLAFRGPQVSPPSAEFDQELFLIDDSSSMNDRALDPQNPALTRWDLVNRVLPVWLSRLDSGVQVGAVSIGGGCGETPTIELPVGSDRAAVLAALGSARPHGSTNLNTVLRAAPSLFKLDAAGSKHILLLSDGADTCAPDSTCAIARELNERYGIRIDIVAWITDPGMADEFRCMAAATGGSFSAPQTAAAWSQVPLALGGFDPWPYIVLTLGLVTTLIAGGITYRQLHRGLGWETGIARVVASAVVIVLATGFYLALFTASGTLVAVLGFLVLVGFFLTAVLGRSQDHSPRTTAPPLWALVVAALISLGAATATAEAHQQASHRERAARASDAPTASDQSQSRAAAAPEPQPAALARYRHILVLDGSGSVTDVIDQMKDFLVAYADKARPGEEITVVLFSADEQASVRELKTFTVGPSGAANTLAQILDDLKTQDPRRTKTLFRPLADFLNTFLKGVQLQPVIITVSDGVSDEPQTDLPFEALGTRGVYRAPGIQGWKVAVLGGEGLDLTDLFRRPLGGGKTGSGRRTRTAVAVDPALVDPVLVVDCDPTLTLRPAWWPPFFASTSVGEVTLRVSHERVTRFSSFIVRVGRGSDFQTVGRVDNVPISTSPNTFTFPVTQPVSAADSEKLTIQLVIDQGDGQQKVVYPHNQPAVTVVRQSYLGAYGLYALALVGLLGAGFTATAVTTRRRQVRARTRPEIVKIAGGPATIIRPGQSVSIGGDGCPLSIPGVLPGCELGFVEWSGVHGEVLVRPADAVDLKVDGIEAAGATRYRLGRRLQFVTSDGGVHDVVLHPASIREAGFGSLAEPVAGDFGGPAGTGPSGIGSEPLI